MTTEKTSNGLIPPYGGKLINLAVSDEEREALVKRAKHLPSIQISTRARCDLELLATGAFSPLDRFMGRADYENVLENMRLSDGTLFPLPITLTVNDYDLAHVGEEIALRDSRNYLLAVMQIEEAFVWNRDREASLALGTTDTRHPLASEMIRWGKICISGTLKVVNLPRYYDFVELRRTPAQVRTMLAEMDIENVVAFQTRNPLHRIHEALTKMAAADVNGALLLHPVVGTTKPGDVDHYSRVRIYRTLVDRYYNPDRTLLSLLPLAMRMAGPREALWHAIIRRNFGANHLIVGRDHAGPGNDSNGKPFYGPYDAQDLVTEHAKETGVKPLPFKELVYLPDKEDYVQKTEVPAGTTQYAISGTQVREEYLAKGKLLPEWFTRPETAEVLTQMYPPRHKRGFCIWLTGLSAAGKSTTARVLTSALLEQGRPVTILDGDVVRTHLSKGLGFTRDDRNTNILRIGFVASEIIRHNGIAICATVSPYRDARNEARKIIGDDSFIEIYVDTPIEICEERDDKGLYARARRGEIKGFTGIDDPYEAPINAAMVLNTIDISPEENVAKIVEYLTEKGYLKDDTV